MKGMVYGICLIIFILAGFLVTTLGMNLQVDLEGAYRGRTIGDRAHDRLTDSHKTTQVAVRVDIARFKSQFLDRITALASH